MVTKSSVHFRSVGSLTTTIRIEKRARRKTMMTTTTVAKRKKFMHGTCVLSVMKWGSVTPRTNATFVPTCLKRSCRSYKIVMRRWVPYYLLFVAAISPYRCQGLCGLKQTPRQTQSEAMKMVTSRKRLPMIRTMFWRCRIEILSLTSTTQRMKSSCITYLLLFAFCSSRHGKQSEVYSLITASMIISLTLSTTTPT